MLDAGSSMIVNFTVTEAASGAYQVDVNGVTSSFMVESSAPAPMSAEPAQKTPISEPKNGNTSWLIVLVIAGAALVAIAAMVFVIVRGRRR